MRKLAIFAVALIVLLTLVACGAPAPVPTATPAPTYTPYPTYTPVPVPTQPPPPPGQPTYTPYPTYTPAPTAIPVVVVATAGPTPTPAPPKTLKIGVLQAFTGPGSAWGVGAYRGILLAQQDINAAGGIKVGADRYMVQLVTWDSKYGATDAVTGINKFISQDGIKYIHGGTGTGDTMAIRQIAEANKVLQMFGSWSVDAPGPLGFRNNASGTREIATIVPWLLKQNPQIKKVATSASNDPVGKMAMPRHITAWKAAGIDVVWSDYYQGGTTDFAPFLTSALAKNPDLIDLCTTYPADAALQVKQLRELGYTGLISIESYQTPEDLMKVVPVKSLEGFYFAYTYLNRPNAPPEQKAFYDRAMAAFGPPLQPLVEASYTTWMAVAATIEKTGTLDTTVVAKGLEGGEFKSVMGIARFLADKPDGLAHGLAEPFQMVMIKDGVAVALTEIAPTIAPTVW